MRDIRESRSLISWQTVFAVTQSFVKPLDLSMGYKQVKSKGSMPAAFHLHRLSHLKW
jgi:hypothetical protein